MNRRRTAPIGAMILALGLAPAALAADWAPAKGPLMTRWAKDVSPATVHREYPRPQLVRAAWMNLNGPWQLAFQDGEFGPPPVGKTLPETILVPFPVESALSGVMKPADRVWYRRTFQVPANWYGQRLILHFGAVDWEATVYLNGKLLGTHKGGYDAFSFDATDAARPAAGVQELLVAVYDPSDAGAQPRGKQVEKPGGIFYTPTTGIWQTVWMEPVPVDGVQGLKIVPDIDAKKVVVTVEGMVGTPVRISAGEPTELQVKKGDVVGEVLPSGNPIASMMGVVGTPIELPIPTAKLWTPESPYLYNLTVVANPFADAGADTVQSYFGMRKISVGPDENGVTRLLLNNKPLFQVGPLDQGFWPDGLYTAPTDEALRFDVEVTKKLGFNMTRKHVKVEPDRWYYWCDKLGLIVWQDMPSGDRSIGPDDPDIVRSAASKAAYEAELKSMIDGLRNHPSIVMWVIFNEGWGQFDTAKYAKWTKQYDPTRLVDSASGWTDRAAGDVHDFHSYPAPSSPKPEPMRAAVLGEFGGLGLKVDGHTWEDKIWGYQGTASRDELTRKYEKLMAAAWDLRASEGLSAAVYTQITDVETEANGLLTYDREVFKLDPDRAAAINRGDLSRVPIVRDVVATSRLGPATWKYATTAPGDDWIKPGFDDSAWMSGPGGFGTKITPNTTVRTEWSTPDIWIRREATIPEGVDPARLLLSAYHDEDAEVYLNGVLAASFKGYVGSYGEEVISDEAKAAIKPGAKVVICVHCHQTGGGQYVDVGLIEQKDRTP